MTGSIWSRGRRKTPSGGCIHLSSLRSTKLLLPNGPATGARFEASDSATCGAHKTTQSDGIPCRHIWQGASSPSVVPELSPCRYQLSRAGSHANRTGDQPSPAGFRHCGPSSKQSLPALVKGTDRNRECGFRARKLFRHGWAASLPARVFPLRPGHGVSTMASAIAASHSTTQTGQRIAPSGGSEVMFTANPSG